MACYVWGTIAGMCRAMGHRARVGHPRDGCGSVSLEQVTLVECSYLLWRQYGEQQQRESAQVRTRSRESAVAKPWAKRGAAAAAQPRSDNTDTRRDAPTCRVRCAVSYVTTRHDDRAPR